MPEISDLVVAAACRRRGLASALMALEARARAAGHAVVVLGVGPYADSGAAQQLLRPPRLRSRRARRDLRERAGRAGRERARRRRARARMMRRLDPN
jgi:ribosomal protein S18 acetylase RimI-like enzyme